MGWIPNPGRILVPIYLLSLVLSACGTNDPTPTPVTKKTVSIPQPTSPAPANDNWWKPTVGLSWQWELSDDPIDATIPAEVYDIDLYADQSQIEELHARGAKIICYISVGSWEEWRPDADQFPEEVLGNDYDGWPGEKWLDIRRIDLLTPIIRARLDLCKAKGFNAVEPDNMQIWDNDTGFPLTAEDQLRYARWLADETHTHGLAIGQKNAPDQTDDLVELYDFAITEDCFEQGWCEQMLPYIRAGKPVFAAEYTDTRVDFKAACAWGKTNGFSFILKNRDLDAWIQTCQPTDKP